MYSQVTIIYRNMTPAQRERWMGYTREVVAGKRETMSIDFMLQVQRDEDIETDPVDDIATKLERYKSSPEEEIQRDEDIKTDKGAGYTK